MVAADRLSGALRWSRDLAMPVSTDCGGSKKVGFWGSAAVVGDVVYAAGPDGNATALRRSEGSTLWTAKIADGTAAGHGEFVQSSPAAAVGEVLFVESSAPDGTAGALEVLEQSSGEVLKSFSGSVAIFGAPSVGHGFVVFGNALGHATALVAPKYR